MRSFEHKILINASPERIFRLYADVEGWKTWDLEVEWSTLDGSFAAGSRGKLKPPKAPASAIRLLDVRKNQSFTVESTLPLCRMRFEHELVLKDGSTETLHRVSFTGPLSPLFALLIGRKINSGFPRTLAGLKRVAEQSG